MVRSRWVSSSSAVRLQAHLASALRWRGRAWFAPPPTMDCPPTWGSCCVPAAHLYRRFLQYPPVGASDAGTAATDETVVQVLRQSINAGFALTAR